MAINRRGCMARSVREREKSAESSEREEETAKQGQTAKNEEKTPSTSAGEVREAPTGVHREFKLYGVFVGIFVALSSDRAALEVGSSLIILLLLISPLQLFYFAISYEGVCIVLLMSAERILIFSLLFNSFSPL